MDADNILVYSVWVHGKYFTPPTEVPFFHWFCLSLTDFSWMKNHVYKQVPFTCKAVIVNWLGTRNRLHRRRTGKYVNVIEWSESQKVKGVFRDLITLEYFPPSDILTEICSMQASVMYSQRESAQYCGYGIWLPFDDHIWVFSRQMRSCERISSPAWVRLWGPAKAHGGYKRMWSILREKSMIHRD